MNLTSVIRLSGTGLSSSPTGIYAAATEDAAQWQAVQALRAQGERVVCGLSAVTDNLQALHCDRQLVCVDGQYQVQAI